MSKVLANKCEEDEKRLESLEEELKKARAKAEDADTKYEEVAKKLAQCETDLERAEERADTGETMTTKLKQAEARAEFAEKSVQKLQHEVDRLEDELAKEMEKYKTITEELELTFAEMSGY